jgi:hypothetical protein
LSTPGSGSSGEQLSGSVWLENRMSKTRHDTRSPRAGVNPWTALVTRQTYARNVDKHGVRTIGYFSAAPDDYCPLSPPKR